MNSDLRFEVEEDNFYFASFVYDKNDDIQEVGRFQISKLLPDTPHSMSINVDENYQGQRLSMLLISNLLKYIITKKKISENTYFYIDTDASEGFWTKIGMEPTPEDDDEYDIYEKRILLSDLNTMVSKYLHDRKLFSAGSKSPSKSVVNDGSESKRVIQQNPAAGFFRKSHKKTKKTKKRRKRRKRTKRTKRTKTK
jgi:hypothetical protein